MTNALRKLSDHIFNILKVCNFINSLVNLRRACAARVTVLGMRRRRMWMKMYKQKVLCMQCMCEVCVCVCVSVCVCVCYSTSHFLRVYSCHK